MSNIEELRATYLKDADLMASKSRFGYFSIPPTASAGVNAHQQKKIVKDENGKVKTEQRNIFSGLTASGVLKKSYFNYQKSVYQGDPYLDPGKQDKIQKLQQSKKLAGKDVYKPLSLVKTPSPKAAYDHIPQKPQQKTVKDVIDQSGKVKTQNRNIYTNSPSNIEKVRLKQFKYVPDIYQNHITIQRNQNKKSITQRGEAPFKSSSPLKGQFSTFKQTYGLDQRYKSSRKQHKPKQNKTVEHEANFKPSCSKNFDTFSYPQYIPGGQKLRNKQRKTDENKSKQPFKLIAPYQNSKPSPSITTLKSNILRCIR